MAQFSKDEIQHVKTAHGFLHAAEGALGVALMGKLNEAHCDVCGEELKPEFILVIMDEDCVLPVLITCDDCGIDEIRKGAGGLIVHY